MPETQAARSSPVFIGPVVETVGELGLLAAYALVFLLTVLVVSASAVACAALAIPRVLSRGVSASAASSRARETSTAASPQLWHANPSGGRR